MPSHPGLLGSSANPFPADEDVNGYSVRDVASMLGLSPARVRSLAALVGASPGEDHEIRFRFHELVLLRTARGLLDARVPTATVRRALARLREQMPPGRPLSAVRITADGRRVIARDGDLVWNPESGQVMFDFARNEAEMAARAEPYARRAAADARADAEGRTADDWYRFGCDVEASSPSDAADAYGRALALSPEHADAHVNLGRLLHEGGKAEEAAAHYLSALEAEPSHAYAAFDLGVALEDLGRDEEAARAYERAIAGEPGLANAHYNLALLFERTGRGAEAIRHLKLYKKLIADE